MAIRDASQTSSQPLVTVNQWLENQKSIYYQKAEDSAGTWKFWKSLGAGVGAGAALGTVLGIGLNKGLKMSGTSSSWIGVGLGVTAAAVGTYLLTTSDIFKGKPNYPSPEKIEQMALNHGGSSSTSGEPVIAPGSNLWTGDTFAESVDDTGTTEMRAKYGEIDRDSVYATVDDALEAARAEGGNHVVMRADKALTHEGGDPAMGEPSTPPSAGYYVYDVAGNLNALLDPSTGQRTELSLPENLTWLQHGDKVLIQRDGKLLTVQEPIEG